LKLSALTILFFIVNLTKVFCQNVYVLEILEKKSGSFEQTKSDFKKKFVNPFERNQEVKKVLTQLYETGFITASIDSSFEQDQKLTILLNSGLQYKWAILKKGNVDEGVLSSIGFREKIYAEKEFSYKQISRLFEKLLKHYENNGYPFAEVSLDSVDISGDKIKASLNTKKNKRVQVDSILIKGSVKISEKYIQNYLGVKEGSLYNEQHIRKIPTKLKELPFLSEATPFEVSFSETATKLIFNLEPRKASQFDGILGFLPDEETGKLLITGQGHLKLQNAIGKGELIDVDWRKLQTQTQDLKTHFVYPFLFSSPLGLDLAFNLYKKDTSFIDLNQNAGIQYILTGANYVKAYVNKRNSNLLSSSGAGILTNNTLADIVTTSYGLGLRIESLDYRINPRKGIRIISNNSVGNKTIKTSKIADPELVQNIDIKSVQYNIDLQVEVFIPLFKRSTLNLGSKTAHLIGKDIFQNELFRIGGLRTLRGFDEESIFTSSYTIGNIEYRYLFEQNSYLYLFSNAAYYENRSLNFSGDPFDMPFGFGAGISFETKAGIFTITYALGKQFNNPIIPRSAKIHFGIVNYF